MELRTVERIPHDLQVLLRHRLPPLLGETFGGSTGLVDVEVDRDTRDHAVHPFVDICFSGSNVPSAASRTGVLANDSKHHCVAEVQNLLQFVPKLLEGAPPLFDEATNRHGTLKHTQSVRRRVVHTIGRAEAHQSVEVATIDSLPL